MRILILCKQKYNPLNKYSLEKIGMMLFLSSLTKSHIYIRHLKINLFYKNRLVYVQNKQE